MRIMNQGRLACSNAYAAMSVMEAMRGISEVVTPPKAEPPAGVAWHVGNNFFSDTFLYSSPSVDEAIKKRAKKARTKKPRRKR